jgi:hypothetical protein
LPFLYQPRRHAVVPEYLTATGGQTEWRSY